MKYKSIIRFNGVYSIDNLPKKIKDGAYIINLDEYSDTGTQWIALHALHNNVTYLTVLELNTFQKKFKNLLIIKTYKIIFLEYKHIIQ